MIGDIVGRPGEISFILCSQLKRDREIDFVIANGENAAGGNGITPAVADEIFSSGVDIITGNHIWDKRRSMIGYGTNPGLFALQITPNTPGRGYFISEVNDESALRL